MVLYLQKKYNQSGISAKKREKSNDKCIRSFQSTKNNLWINTGAQNKFQSRHLDTLLSTIL